MIKNFKYNLNCDRKEVLDHLKQANYKTVIDLGISAGAWSLEHTTHYVDVVQMKNKNLFGFIGSLCLYSTWEKILDYVKINGKFDFSICSHTLEDIGCPQLVCELLPKISKSGYIAIPSKYKELKNHEGPYVGWIHHRWIYNKEGDEFVAYPKLNHIDHHPIKNRVLQQENSNVYEELSFFWEDDFKLRTINDDYMGPSFGHVLSYYNGLEKN